MRLYDLWKKLSSLPNGKEQWDVMFPPKGQEEFIVGSRVIWEEKMEILFPDMRDTPSSEVYTPDIKEAGVVHPVDVPGVDRKSGVAVDEPGEYYYRNKERVDEALALLAVKLGLADEDNLIFDGCVRRDSDGGCHLLRLETLGSGEVVDCDGGPSFHILIRNLDEVMGGKEGVFTHHYSETEDGRYVVKRAEMKTNCLLFGHPVMGMAIVPTEQFKGVLEERKRFFWNQWQRRE